MNIKEIPSILSAIEQASPCGPTPGSSQAHRLVSLVLSLVLFAPWLLAFPQASKQEGVPSPKPAQVSDKCCCQKLVEKLCCEIPENLVQNCCCSGEKEGNSEEFDHLMQLGEAYERAGRLKEAEDVYRRALELKTKPDRDLAIRRLESVLGNWGFLEWWRNNRLAISIWFVVVAIAAIVPSVAYMLWRRKRRLRVRPIDAPDEANVPATHLERIGEYLVGLMRFYAAKAGPIDDTKLPFVWPAFAEDLRSKVEALLPGPRGTVGSWLVGWLFKPDFELQGTLATSSQQNHIILTLCHRGGTTRSWEVTVAQDLTHNALKDLVYDVLLYIKDQAS